MESFNRIIAIAEEAKAELINKVKLGTADKSDLEALSHAEAILHRLYAQKEENSNG